MSEQLEACRPQNRVSLHHGIEKALEVLIVEACGVILLVLRPESVGAILHEVFVPVVGAVSNHERRMLRQHGECESRGGENVDGLAAVLGALGGSNFLVQLWGHVLSCTEPGAQDARPIPAFNRDSEAKVIDLQLEI